MSQPETIYGLPLGQRVGFLMRQALNFFGATPHDRERFWMHGPVGILAATLTLWDAPTGIVFAGSFLIYEIVQDWRKGDSSYKDVFGYVMFYGATAAVRYGLSWV